MLTTLPKAGAGMTSDSIESIPSILATTLLRRFPTTLIAGVPQGPNGKTKKAIEKMIEEVLNNMTPWLALKENLTFENRTDENPPRIIHTVNLVFTDNSIVQSNQWTKRLADENKIVVWNLGSCKDAHHSNISSVIHKLFHAKTVDELPNVIVMCTHQKRFEDIVELVEYIRMNWHGNNLFKFKLNCFFDEPDVTTNASKIFKFLDELKKMDDERDYIINEMVHISATFMGPYIKTLYEDYIDTDQCRTLYSCSNLDKYRSVLMNDCKIIDKKYDTMNPAEAAKTLMDEEGIAQEPGKKIIFAPADVKVESHTRMREMFQNEYRYDVLVINGKEKKFYIRDHYSGTYSEKEIYEFKREYNIKGELRDILLKYNELYPNNNLVITGHNCLKRGVTFNTDGFSFTHAFYTTEIDSDKLVEYIHLCSRSAGHQDYTHLHTVFITKKLHECMDKYLHRMETCIEGNIQMNETSMDGVLPKPEKKAPRGINAAAQYIPLVIRDARVLGIPKSKNDKEKYIRKIILDFDPHYLDGHEKHEILEPRTELSKKRNIYDLVKKFELQQKYSWGVRKDDRLKNIWSVAIDRENERIVVTKHTGKRLNPLSTD